MVWRSQGELNEKHGEEAPKGLKPWGEGCR